LNGFTAGTICCGEVRPAGSPAPYAADAKTMQL
jgi:hypothetical protein